jgi:hypothetical protein
MNEQIKTYDFYRESNVTRFDGIPVLHYFGPAKDRWYIDLPEWRGPKANLEMVQGADTLLEILANGNERVNVTFSNFLSPSFQPEIKLTHMQNGDYELTKLNNDLMTLPNEIWLCGVTQFVFQSDYPDFIYLKKN